MPFKKVAYDILQSHCLEGSYLANVTAGLLGPARVP